MEKQYTYQDVESVDSKAAFEVYSDGSLIGVVWRLCQGAWVHSLHGEAFPTRHEAALDLDSSGERAGGTGGARRA